MMKKLLALMLAALMLVSVVACNDTTTDDTTVNGGDTTVGGEEDKTPENNGGNTDITPNVETNTMGSVLWDAFKSAIEANASISMEELANTLITNPVIQFMGGAAPVEKEAEFFEGFDNYKIEGFESGAKFMPMISSIPFMGYVFELAEDADVSAFVAKLNDNCNPRWFGCVTAEQVVAGSIGNKVLFLMCSKDLPEIDATEEPTVIYPDVEDNTLGIFLWEAFDEGMTANPDMSVEEMATVLITHPSIQFMGGAIPVEKGTEFFDGFDNYKIEGFESAAKFMPMISSIPFMGYVFELAEDADVSAFMNMLTENCNPSWFGCVTADQVVVGAFNNTVFFLMCPASAA